MSEPLSLFASCAELLKVAKALHKVVRTTQEQHATVQLLRIDAKMLIQTVEKLQSFEDESLCKAMEATETIHWRDVKQVLADCQTTVNKLNRFMTSHDSNQSRSVLSRTLKLGNDTSKDFSAITLLRKELRLQRDSLDLSMNIIQLYAPCLLQCLTKGL